MKKTLSTKEHSADQSMSNMRTSAASVHSTQANNAANAAYTEESMQLSPNINIAIETDDGYIQPPEIDDIEEQQENFQPDSSDNESTHSAQSGEDSDKFGYGNDIVEVLWNWLECELGDSPIQPVV